MKKIILFTLALLATVSCFARGDEESRTNSFNFTLNTRSDTAIMFNFGDTFYNTKRFNDVFRDSDDNKSNGFTGEIGTFKSDEDGLFDFIQTSTFGFGGGKIYDIDDYICHFDDINFYSDGNSRHFNFYFKDTFGLQVNVFFISFGFSTGPKIGYDWMKMEGNSSIYGDVTMHENRIFLDWNIDPYISLNLNNVKIFLKADSDFPVFRARFQYLRGDRYKSGTDIKWDWFKNDVPMTYMVGCAIFL